MVHINGNIINVRYIHMLRCYAKLYILNGIIVLYIDGPCDASGKTEPVTDLCTQGWC